MQAALRGRHALVSGGSRGIGRAVAAVLGQAGATVTILGRNEANLQNAVVEGSAVHYVTADVTRADECRSAIDSVQAKHGAVDILIANAGGAESAPFAKTDAELFRRMLDLNLMGVVHLAHAVFDGMVARGFGRIVAVASLAGLKGYAYVTAYCAAKHAAVGFVRALAQESNGTGVTVNAVCPGYTDTELVRASVERIIKKTGRSREDALKAILGSDQTRLIAPREVADAVLKLCMPENAVSGETVPLYGRV
jgi:NAD(P)-dependent dehydrogenase (short-subunit alcohol dehydrogenase family)